MKYLFLALAIISTFIFLFSTSYSILWCDWIYPKAYEYSLKLSDDSSLPTDKAQYLTEYLDKVKTIIGTPRYIFMTPDLELDKQIVILEGLIQRFDDIAEISPSEMAYQQGMEQLTGQEMDHQLDRISGIFKSAKLRENVINFLFVSVFWWIFFILATIFWIIFFVLIQ